MVPASSSIDPAAGIAGNVRCRSVAATRRIGQRLASVAEPGTVFALTGELGAGKTQFAKGVARGLGVTSVVNSPTFIILNEHHGRLPLFHADVYRLDNGDEARAAGLFDERQAGGVTVIEWADRIAEWLPADRLDVELVPVDSEPDHRILRWHARGPQHVGLVRRAGLAGDDR